MRVIFGRLSECTQAIGPLVVKVSEAITVRRSFSTATIVDISLVPLPLILHDHSARFCRS